MKNKKNRFVLGFLLGMLSMFIVVGGIGIGLITAKFNHATTVSEVTELKLNLLEKIVDTYYLDEVNTADLKNGVYKGFLAGLNDPYSVYYTKEEYDELKESTSGKYSGIGAVVSQSADTGVITVVRAFKDSPAQQSGIQKDDVLYKVEGKEVTGVDVDKAVLKLKGKEGTTVKVTVFRPSTKKYIDLNITRKSIDVPTVESKMLDEKNKIAYVQITEFDEITESQFRTAVNTLKDKGAKGFIFDIRDNPGGDYEVVCNMLDMLLPSGTIVSTKDKYGNEEKQDSDSSELGLPMVVIQNGNSASASEIFAGAIQDFKLGTIVGTQSFGKGIVQTLLPLTDGSAVKITIEKYYTPSGKNIHGKGITPDVVVEADNAKDNQLAKATEIIKTLMAK